MMMKRVLLVLITMCLTGKMASAEAPNANEIRSESAKAVPAGKPFMANRIEIWVGNEIISTLDIEEPLRQYQEHFERTLRGGELLKKMKEIKEQHINRLIEGKLLLLEARDQDMEIQDTLVEEQVDKEMEQLRAQFPSHQEFKAELEKQHLTEKEFKRQREQTVRENLLRQRLLQYKIQEFKTGAEVSEEQLQEYYTEHKDSFTKPVRVHLYQVFVSRPSADLSADEYRRQDQIARRKIESAAAELRSGKDFTAVARAMSEHKLTAERGGDLGWIEEGDVGLPEFERMAFRDLRVGQVSGVVDTIRGYFILRLDDKQSGGEIPFEEVKGRIRKAIMAEGSDQRYQAWLETLKDKFKIKYADS